MIFTTALFNQSFIIGENEIPILIIENKEFYRNFVKDLLFELDGVESQHLFSINSKEVNLQKYLEVITDVFNVDINKTKNLTKLYSSIKNDISLETYYMETQGIINKIIEYINMVSGEVDYKLSFDDNLEVQSLFKMVNLKFCYEETTLLEKIIDYIKIMNTFFNKKIFVILNFKSLFTNDEQVEFYKFLQYSKIEVLIVESEQPNEQLELEKYRIIDKDLCVIY